MESVRSNGAVLVADLDRRRLPETPGGSPGKVATEDAHSVTR
jgi:hypothetical protein